MFEIRMRIFCKHLKLSDFEPHFYLKKLSDKNYKIN